MYAASLHCRQVRWTAMMLMVVDCLPDKLPTVVDFLGLQELCSDELCPQLVERHKLAILHVGHAELGF